MTQDTALVPVNASPVMEAAHEMYDRLAVVRSVLAPDLSDAELSLFAMVAQRSGLDPFAKQIYAIKRGGRVTFQTGIDGLRSGAESTREYRGSDDPEYGPACECGKAPAGHPEWARVVVYRFRDGQRIGQPATAWYHEYATTQGDMWTKMPRNQLAKCAEALALRKAFPYVLSDVYANEEMDQAGGPQNTPAAAAAAQPTAKERLAARRAALTPEEPAAVEAPAEDAAAPQDPAPAAEEGTFREDVPTAEPDAVPEANLTGCQWRLGQGPGKPTLLCGIEGDHTDHSWQPVAMTTGGRVIRPA